MATQHKTAAPAARPAPASAARPAAKSARSGGTRKAAPSAARAPSLKAAKASAASKTANTAKTAKTAAASKPAKAPAPRPQMVERVQTGFRMEKRLLKVLKAVAEFHDMALGDLVEGIVLHAFDGRSAFGRDSMQRIAEFKRLYGLELDSSHAHRLVEAG